MALGLIGKKVGMTRVFNQETGSMIPVTVIDVAGNTFAQVKTADKDGYNAVQVAFDAQKESRLSKPVAGHLKKLGIAPVKLLKEFRVEASELPAEGATHPGLGLLEDGAWVDVIGTSKGKGFQGAMRRHNFHGSPAAHGSMMHRRTGSVGACATPSRVWKGQKMPGHMGNENTTVQNLRVVQVRNDDNVILVSGPVPGARGSYVVIRPAKKKQGK
ncbi:50S ribosomal protein L3 [Akkermansia glycaniphila]|uniref:Large ribosomal subunit protein uL3 n=1 Tax=Akkermansia glycaniphila TaxID=1679444 RepID=A0A1C7PD42_9BACT|nr:50S ribosomal protein L3 [Akkermansia glycaniphila]OCA03314.1 50S ribosomal protein L3 [Akkermansia glycaniphila]SEH80651.1 l3 bact: 50s ribosomal protein ul3 [Akkermansia glycaniphila]